MGCAGSRSALFVRESPLTEALEKKLIETIITIKQRKLLVVKKNSFNNLMLQLPKLIAGFKKIREAHASISGPTSKVTWGTFRARSTDKLGLVPDSESLREVLSLPNVGEAVLVTHPDLILIYTVVFLLDGPSRRQSLSWPEVRACLDLMGKSFMFFDSSADGCIERQELAMAMKSGTRVFGRKASKTLADHLFDQLDWSRDGQITFKEFLIGMERIVMETEGDEEEDGLSGDGEDMEEDLRDIDADWGEEEVKEMCGPQPQQQQQQQKPNKQVSFLAADGDDEQQQQQGRASPFGATREGERPAPESLATSAVASDEVRPFKLSNTGAV